jgi:hypothetical protein
MMTATIRTYISSDPSESSSRCGQWFPKKEASIQPEGGFTVLVRAEDDQEGF